MAAKKIEVIIAGDASKLSKAFAQAVVSSGLFGDAMDKNGSKVQGISAHFHALIGDAGDLDGAFGKLANGAGPSILGINSKVALLTAGVGSLLGALPGLVASFVTLGAAGAGISVLVGSISGLYATNSKLKAQIDGLGPSLKSAFDNAAQPILTSLQPVLKEIPSLINQMGPAFRAVFSGAATLIAPLATGLTSMAKTILPALGQMLKETAPLIQPLLSGFSQFFTGVLNGVNGLLSSAAPAIKALAGGFGALGSDLGSMMSGMGPVITAGSQIFSDLLKIISELFPIIGTLADAFAKALAPAATAFTNAIDAVLPVIGPLATILGNFAAAVLTDLSGALQAVATLIKDMAPTFTILSKAAQGVFNTLENSGVFAEFSSALEQVAPLLANLVNQFVKGLGPVLPSLTNLFSVFVNSGINVLASGMTALAPILTDVATVLSSGLGTILTAITPLLVQLAPVLAGVVVAVKAWAIAQGILDTVLDANPIGVIVVAIAALAAGIVYAYEHVQTFRDICADVFSVVKTYVGTLKVAFDVMKDGVVAAFNAVKDAGKAVIDFITSNWKLLAPILLGPLAPLGEIVTHFGAVEGAASAAWGGVEKAASSAVSALTGTVSQIAGVISEIPTDVKDAVSGAATWLINAGGDIIHGLVQGIEDATGSVVSAIKHVADLVPNAFKSVLKIFSPSKVMADVGKWIPEGLAAGIYGNVGPAIQAMEKLAKSVGAYATSAMGEIKTGLSGSFDDLAKDAAKAASQISTEFKGSQVAKALNSDSTQITALTKKYDALTTSIQDAQSAKSQLDSEVSSTASSLESSYLTPSLDANGNAIPITANQIEANLNQQVQNLQTFQQVLLQLKAQGLSIDVLAQLVAAGPTDGLAAAQSLLGQGSIISALNQQESELELTSSSIGSMVDTVTYDGQSVGEDTINGIISGLQGQQGTLGDTISGIAADMEKTLKDDLGIASPSKVFAEVGKWVPAGMAQGILGNKDVVTKAVGKMTSLPGKAGATSGLAVSGSASGATVNQHFYNAKIGNSRAANVLANKLAHKVVYG